METVGGTSIHSKRVDRRSMPRRNGSEKTKRISREQDRTTASIITTITNSNSLSLLNRMAEGVVVEAMVEVEADRMTEAMTEEMATSERLSPRVSGSS